MLSSRDATVLEMLTVLDAEKQRPCCSWTMQGPCAAANHKDQCTRLIPSILPLNLVRRLVGGLNHPGPGAKLKELDPPKGLAEQIRKVVLGVDVARLDASSSKQPRMKWYLTRMCLLRSWKTGFFARARADLLSTLSSTASVSLQRSPSSRASQSA